MDNFEKKYAKFDEVVSLVQQAVKEPENSGNYHDYIELCNLGDEIPKEDTVKLLDELAGVEDEDGFIPYKPF